jgi:hypothetical protein
VCVSFRDVDSACMLSNALLCSQNRRQVISMYDTCSLIQVLAVKKLDNIVMPFQSSDDFAELVSNISKLHHPNLNELVGYCMEHGQHLSMISIETDLFMTYSTFQMSTASHLAGTLMSKLH